MTRSAEATVRRPGARTAPATSVSTRPCVRGEKASSSPAIQCRRTAGERVVIIHARRRCPGQEQRGGGRKGTMARSDPMLARIRAFDRARGGGVAVERANKGYSLFSVATGAPRARLRPTGRDDEVEILWWRRGRWGAIGDFGGLRMPLDDALGHIADDPLFWSGARTISDLNGQSRALARP